MRRQILVQRNVKYKTISSNEMVIIEGGGAVAAFASLFLFSGLIFILLFGFNLISLFHVELIDEEREILGLFGVPFFLTGAYHVFKRRWIFIDISRNSMIIKWGLLIPMFSKSCNWNDFINITLSHQDQSGDINIGRHYPECYPVIISGGSYSKNLSVNDFKTYGEAYDHATKLAAFLKLPLIDKTTDHQMILKSGEMDSPLQMRLKTDSKQLNDIAPIENMKSHIQPTNLGVVITIPMQMTEKWLFIIQQISIIFGIFLISTKHKYNHNYSWTFVVNNLLIISLAALLIFMPTIKLFFRYLKIKNSLIVVSVDKQNITIEYLFLGKKTKQENIAVSDIIDVDSDEISIKIKDPKGVILKTKNGLFNFGAGLPSKEVEYLVKIIKRQLIET